MYIVKVTLPLDLVNSKSIGIMFSTGIILSEKLHV